MLILTHVENMNRGLKNQLMKHSFRSGYPRERRSTNLGPEHEQETSFGGRSRTSVLHKEYLVGKIYELIGNKMHQRLEPNLSLFVLGKDGRLYYKGKPLMKND